MMLTVSGNENELHKSDIHEYSSISLCRLVFLRILETTLFMAFYVFKVASEVTKLVVISGILGVELQLFSHVLSFLSSTSKLLSIFLPGNLTLSYEVGDN